MAWEIDIYGSPLSFEFDFAFYDYSSSGYDIVYWYGYSPYSYYYSGVLYLTP